MQIIYRRIVKLLWLLPITAALILYSLLPYYPHITEMWFSSGIFCVLSSIIGTINAFIPISFTELLVILAIPITCLIVVHMVYACRVYSIKKTVCAYFNKGLWILSSTLLLYMLMHGANFYRQPVSELMQLDTSQKTPEYLQEVCIKLAERSSVLRKKLREDANGVALTSQPPRKLIKDAGEGYRILEKKYSFLAGSVYSGKPVMLSRPWSYTGITGMYFPFFCEPNINIDIPVYDVPFTATHELAHTRGFAREDECNFLAFLACISHPSVDYQYSGYLSAYIYCSNALYSYDEDMFSAVYAKLSEEVKRDLSASSVYWDQFKGEIQEVSTSINDAFITAQGDEHGVLSYDRVVSLILAWYDK